MNSTDNFRATIALGCVALLIMAAAAFAVDRAGLVAVAVLAAMAYATQALATIADAFADQASVTHIDDEAGMARLLTISARWHRASMFMWLATLIAGAWVLVGLLLAVR